MTDSLDAVCASQPASVWGVGSPRGMAQDAAATRRAARSATIAGVVTFVCCSTSLALLVIVLAAYFGVITP